MKDEIKKACEVLQKGGVILYPTDTVWGIGCDATNEEAVRRVYEIKKRADSKAMLVLVDTPVKVDFYVKDVPVVAWDLIEMATRPLTIIYDGARNLAPNLIAEDGSVGIRVTNEEFSRQLCFRFRKAIVSLRPISVASRLLPCSVKSVKRFLTRWIMWWITVVKKPDTPNLPVLSVWVQAAL